MCYAVPSRRGSREQATALRRTQCTSAAALAAAARQSTSMPKRDREEGELDDDEDSLASALKLSSSTDDNCNGPLLGITPAMSERVSDLARKLAAQPLLSPGAYAAALLYLQVLDALKGMSTRRVKLPDHLRLRLLTACGVHSSSAEAQARRNAVLPGADILHYAKACAWLWSDEEMCALTDVQQRTMSDERRKVDRAASSLDAATLEQLRRVSQMLPMLPTLPVRLVSDGDAASRAAVGAHIAARSSSLKLELVLDLDHTCVHATEVHGEGCLATAHAPGTHEFYLSGVSGQPSRYKLRLRDGLGAFLREVVKIAHVHVYTMGSMSYTREVLNLIDPAHSFTGIFRTC